MESIREIYRIGYGPSSSHTMGPRKAAEIFRDRYPEAAEFRAILYGSLAATGKGHQTDRAIREALQKPVAFEWRANEVLPQHPNGMKLLAVAADGQPLGEWLVFSVGGGKISDFSQEEAVDQVYPLSTMKDILKWTRETGKSLWEFVYEHEDDKIVEYLHEVWFVMQAAIRRGIDEEGLIPGGLRLSRKASSYYVRARNYTGSLKSKTLTFAYALAVSEENACGGQIVTAPTCGSCGVVPAVLQKLVDSFDFSEAKLARALATAGLIGNLVKTNASISGAEVGCQGEIGTACAMAAAAAAQLLGGTPYQIEYAAEMAMEHHLGLTCDPIAGLVQVPCIERNAFAAERALTAATYALLSDGRHMVSFDRVVNTMNRTGHDLPKIYRETSDGGLAVIPGN